MMEPKREVRIEYDGISDDVDSLIGARAKTYKGTLINRTVWDKGLTVLHFTFPTKNNADTFRKMAKRIIAKWKERKGIF